MSSPVHLPRLSLAVARRSTAVLSLAAITALLILAARRLDLARASSELLQARPGWVLAAIICYMSILPLWAAQWYLLAPATARRTPRRMLGVVAMASSTMHTTWTLVGEATGVYLLGTITGVDRPAGVAVLAMDQLLAGLAKVAVVAAAAITLPLPDWLAQGAKALAVAVALLTAGLLIVAWGGAPVRRRLRQLTPARFTTVTSDAISGLAPLLSPTRGSSAMILALLKKLAELLAIMAIQRAFGVALPVSSALLVLAALSIASLIRVLPGNVGMFEAAVVLSCVHLGMTAERALGVAVVLHACSFFALALPGYYWFARAGARA